MNTIACVSMFACIKVGNVFHFIHTIYLKDKQKTATSAETEVVNRN